MMKGHSGAIMELQYSTDGRFVGREGMRCGRMYCNPRRCVDWCGVMIIGRGRCLHQSQCSGIKKRVGSKQTD